MTVLKAVLRPPESRAKAGLPTTQLRPAAHSPLIMAGAAGAWGQAMLHRLVGGGAYGRTVVLTRTACTDALRGLETWLVPSDDPTQWPIPEPWRMAGADTRSTAVISFDQARSWGGRELALWTPAPEQLLPVAGWLHRLGVHTLAVVTPHAQGRLPAALREGLASLDEQGVASLGFARLLLLRAARPGGPEAMPDGWAGWPVRLASNMLSIAQYMVPSNQKTIRSEALAGVLEAALVVLPDGLHVIPPETLWQAAQGEAGQVLEQWAQAAQHQTALP